MKQQLYNHLAFLYGEEQAAVLAERLSRKLVDYATRYPEIAVRRAIDRISERDSILITYGDMMQESDTAPLRSLADFLTAHISGTVSTVRILPFFPYLSDDGFSVIDCVKVVPALGDWADVAQVSDAFRLRIDIQNVLDYTETIIQNVLDNRPRTFDNSFLAAME